MYLASYHVNTNVDYLLMDPDIPGHLIYLTVWIPLACEVFLVEPVSLCFVQIRI